MLSPLDAKETFTEYCVHIAESPFLKKRQEPIAIRITTSNADFAAIESKSPRFVPANSESSPWLISPMGDAIKYIPQLHHVPSWIISACEEESNREMMTCIEMPPGSLSNYQMKLRCRGTEWMQLEKDGDRWQIVDEDGKTLAVYRKEISQTQDHPNLAGIATIDSECPLDQINTFLIIFIHRAHGL